MMLIIEMLMINNDKYDAKTTFFHTNVFHLGIIVLSLQH